MRSLALSELTSLSKDWLREGLPPLCLELIFDAILCKQFKIDVIAILRTFAPSLNFIDNTTRAQGGHFGQGPQTRARGEHRIAIRTPAFATS